MKLANYYFSNFKKNSLENFSSVFFIFKKIVSENFFYNQKNFSEKFSRKKFQKFSKKLVVKNFEKKIRLQIKILMLG
nr:MAG TPA: hypothetical protein [Bacteriophage sp.]